MTHPSSTKPRAGLSYQPPLIFETGKSGRSAISIHKVDLPRVSASQLFGSLTRSESPLLPEVSEPEAVRHYVQLSQQNFAIDTGMYPLGSCTMKYNPKVNEWAARLSGFTWLHPYTPDALAQGALELLWQLERGLAEICGMDGVTLQPAAGAQGEFTALKMMVACHREQGRSPKKVLIPDTAHGTNPATSTLTGLKAVAFPVGKEGIVLPEQLAPFVDDDVAALMITNPNTVGLFETHIGTICKMIHDKGGLVFGDGANLNALMGKVRPGDVGIDAVQLNLHKTFTTPHGGGGPGCGPVAYKKLLDPFVPTPVVVRDEKGNFSRSSAGRPKSIGRVRSFMGNFGMAVRAYTYLREMGAEGLKQATELAVLNANYLRAELSKTWHVAYPRTCMHEVVISDKHLKDTEVTTMDVAKALMDYGFHPPTVYFPLVVKGAMLIEPTETESKETLDRFVQAMQSISDQAQSNRNEVLGAPHLTHRQRLDETRAARNPVLRWKPSST